METLPAIPDELVLPVLFAIVGLLGLISCFSGLKVFKLLVTAVVAVALAITTAVFGFNYGNDPLIWGIGGLIVGAVLGAIFAWGFYRLAVGIMGALFVASLILPWVEALSVTTQLLAFAVACFVGAGMAMMLANLTIQLSSAYIGAFLIVLSVRYFSHGETILRLVDGEESDSMHLVLNLSSTAALIIIAVGTLGFFIQRSKTPD